MSLVILVIIKRNLAQEILRAVISYNLTESLQ